mmetsp:Transcript_36435/g.88217  ORF Transcript_36435/g.88217 Transcript_36435/m.88217 type:complete len:499 (-) Transcript_36435:1518-3014(-)
MDPIVPSILLRRDHEDAPPSQQHEQLHPSRIKPSKKVYDRLKSNDENLQTVEFRYQQIDQRRLAKAIAINKYLKTLELVASVQTAGVGGGFWTNSQGLAREPELCYYYDDYGDGPDSDSENCFNLFPIPSAWWPFCGSEPELGLACEIYTLCCDGIQHNKALVSLNLSQNHLGSYGANCLQQALEHHPSLKVLKLSRCQLEDDGLRKLACSSLGVLEEIDLSCNQISDGIYLGKLLYRNRNMRILDFSKNYLSNVGCEDFLDEHGLGSLRSLNLASNHIGRLGATALGTAMARPSCCLEELILNDNVFLGEAGLLALGTKGLIVNSSIIKLAMNNCSVGDVGAAILAQCLSRHPCIQELTLAANHLTIRGAAACLQSMTTLLKLDLSWNRIGNACYCGDQGFDPTVGQELVAIMKKSNIMLRELNLSHTPLPLAHRRSLDFWTALNRTGCRRLLRQYKNHDSSVLIGLWPQVLAKASDDPEILFHLLTKFPAMLVTPP